MTFKFQDHIDHKRDTGDTPVSKPIPGKNMKENNTGGFVFATPTLKQLERFLVLGTEGGTYYVSEKKLTKDNVKALTQALKDNYHGAIDLIVDISVNARCIKNETCIFALAYAASNEETHVRKYALSKLKEVCRIGTHLFAFMEYSKYFRGRGRLFNNALKDWYLSKDPRDLAYQLVKYQQRNGWAHRDVLRLCKPVPTSNVVSTALRWAVKKQVDMELLKTQRDLDNIIGFELLKQADDLGDVIDLIEQYHFPNRELIPTKWLAYPEVWHGLVINNMPYIAMLRNLGVMTANGAIKPLDDMTAFIAKQICGVFNIVNSKVHPMQILTAYLTYKSGHGFKGSLTWQPVKQIVDALHEAFYYSFKHVEPTGKKYLLCLDISSSMTWNCIGGLAGFTPRAASAVMAMVTMKSEENYHIMGFSDSVTELNISKNDTLEQVIATIDKTRMGSTNIASAIEYALKNKLDVDCFVIYTDNEVNQGRHVVSVLKEYRKKMNKPDAKLAVVAMEVNDCTIADPDDVNMMDFCGFDSNTPAAISAFCGG